MNQTPSITALGEPGTAARPCVADRFFDPCAAPARAGKDTPSGGPAPGRGRARGVVGRVVLALALVAFVLGASRTSNAQIQARPAAVKQEALSAELRVSDATVFEGQRFRVQLMIEGTDTPDQPDLSKITDFDVEFVGAGTNNRSSVVIINGRMQEDHSRGFVFNYDFTPKRVGVLTIPPITVSEGDRRAATQALAIRVNPPGESEDVKVEFTLDPPSPYVGEPTALRVKLSLRTNADPDEFVFRGLTDLFSIPAPAPAPSARQQGIELLGRVVPYTQGQETIGGVQFFTFTAERDIIPSRAGAAEISLTMTGSVVTRPGDGFFTLEQRAPISIRGNTLSVTVRDLPSEGRPPNFNNLVGRFTVSASAEPIAVNVGDPITLRITVNGSGPMDRVPRPDLRRVLGDRFRVPDDMATPELRPGQVIFTQTVRPTSAEAAEIPPIEVPFFDTSTGRYSVARSNPIPLRVASTRVVTSGDAVASLPDAVAAPDLREREEGISANIDAPSILADQRFDLARAARSPAVLGVAVAPAVAYGGAALVLALKRRGGSAAAARRRSAHGTASAALRAADGPEAHARIAKALTGYVADRFDLPAATLTAREAEERLRPVSPEGASALRAVLERCDAARFAGLASGELNELRAAALAALDMVERGTSRGVAR